MGLEKVDNMTSSYFWLNHFIKFLQFFIYSHDLDSIALLILIAILVYRWKQYVGYLCSYVE